MENSKPESAIPKIEVPLAPEVNPHDASAEKRKRSTGWWISKIVTVLGLAYLILVLFSPSTAKINRIGNPEILLFAVILLFNSGLLENLEDFSVSGTGVAAKFRKLEQEVKKDINAFQDEQIEQLKNQQKQLNLLQEQQASTLKFLARYLLEGNELLQLEKINDGNEFLFKYNGDFETQLKRLRGLGFINNLPGKGIASMKEDALKAEREGQQKDLREYFHITEEGKSYLALRESLGINEIPGIGKDGRWYRNIADSR